MTKEERAKLNNKSHMLDVVQDLLHNALVPGSKAQNMIAAQRFIRVEWELVQAEVKREEDRLNTLLEDAETPKEKAPLAVVPDPTTVDKTSESTVAAG